MTSGIPNGDHVTRAELNAHLQTITARQEAVAEKLQASVDHLATAVEHLGEKVDGPAEWAKGRATAIVDRWLPVGVIALIVGLKDAI
ncbi:MAG: hypothetical protein ACKVWR_21855 [Acidimicrobiales bacterium]